MSTIYKKTLKGVEEASLRSQGLQLKFREYLKLVDGVKSADEIRMRQPKFARGRCGANSVKRRRLYRSFALNFCKNKRHKSL